jgi:hypothetical protein
VLRRREQERSGLDAFSLRTTVGVVVVACGLVLLTVGALVIATEHGFEYFARDQASTLVASPLVGLLSHVGVLVTWGAAVVALFSGVFVARARGRHVAAPLLLFGAGVAYLAIDDLFLLHDDIYSQKVGLEQELILLVYAALAVFFLWWYRAFFRDNEWPLLAAAVGALAVAFIFDFEEIHKHLIENDEIKRWVEDSAKLLGLGLLAAYLVRLSARMIVAAYPLAPRVDTGEVEQPEPAPESVGAA